MIVVSPVSVTFSRVISLTRFSTACFVFLARRSSNWVFSCAILFINLTEQSGLRHLSYCYFVLVYSILYLASFFFAPSTFESPYVSPISGLIDTDRDFRVSPCLVGLLFATSFSSNSLRFVFISASLSFRTRFCRCRAAMRFFEGDFDLPRTDFFIGRLS